MWLFNKLQIYILTLLIMSCNSTERGLRNLSASATNELISKDDNTLVLDVRTPQEFAAGHLKGAINVNIYDMDFADQVAELDREKTYVVHCAKNVENGRSSKSMAIMQELGFNDLINMEGGYVAWVKGSLAVYK